MLDRIEMKTIMRNRKQKYDGGMVAGKKERAVTAARPEENPLGPQGRDGDTSILDMITRLSGFHGSNETRCSRAFFFQYLQEELEELRYAMQQSALLGDKAEKTGIGGQRMYSQLENSNDGRGEQGWARYVKPGKYKFGKPIPLYNCP